MGRNDFFTRRAPLARHYSNGDGTITAILTPLPESEIEEQLWPDYENWWTGFVQHDRLNNTYARSDNLIKLEYLYTMGIEEKVRSGWMKFNTSSIPDGSIILSASLRYLVCYFEMMVELQVTALTIDPVTAQPEELFHAIDEGLECAYRTIGRIYDTTDLNAAGAAHIQNTLGQDWVAFGLRGGNFRGILTRKAWITGWNTTPPTDRPHLAVTYQPPQGIGEDIVSDCGLGNLHQTPTIIRDVLEINSKRALPCSRPQVGLYDANGQKMMDLQTGENRIRHLAPGIYFIQSKPSVAHKVIVTR
ncbi:MAG: hypothetical protein ABIK81_03485 [candidate division WOR-3 bacterium]